MHRTIAEFFCAEFIVRSRKSIDLLEKITLSGQVDQFEKAIEFVNEISENLFDEVITKKIALKFIETSKSSRKNKFYKTDIFLFDTEYSIKNDVKKNDVNQKHRNSSYFPIKMTDEKIKLFLEMRFTKKIYAPQAALNKLLELEPNNYDEKKSIINSLGEALLLFLEPEKKYNQSSKEIQSMFNNHDFLTTYPLLLILRGAAREISFSKKPFISVEKCKSLLKKAETTEKSNNELNFLIETL